MLQIVHFSLFYFAFLPNEILVAWRQAFAILSHIKYILFLTQVNNNKKNRYIIKHKILLVLLLPLLKIIIIIETNK